MTAEAHGQHPVVGTRDGPVAGFVHHGRFHVYEFLGIPYAAPPVGNLRWRPPQPPAHWHHVRDATHFANTCAQITTLGVFAGPANDNEDCLYLNVFTPRLAGRDHHEQHRREHGDHDHHRAKKLPVIVWIHGGGLVDGESNDYDASKLAARGPTVVVTINYRLGLLGYLGHPALDNEGHAFGNYGLMDQQMALRWVKKNIAAFGGDPNNVTLGGQSAGSTSTAANVISPAAAGLFHRAIFESAPLLRVVPRAEAEARGTAFAVAAGCGSGTGPSTAACLRALPVSKIMALQGTTSTSGPYVTGLMLDGTIIPMQPDVAYATGQFNHMPIMHGAVEDEWNFILAIQEYFSGPPRVPISAADYLNYVNTTFAPPAYPAGTAAQVLAHYPLANYPTPQIAYDRVGTDSILTCPARHANQLLSRWVPVYAYNFDYQHAPFYFPPMPGFQPLAAHTIDIQFLFPLWHGGPLGIPHPLNTQEKRLSNQLVAFWTNFARTGDPNGNVHKNHPWPMYQPSKGNYFSENIPHSSVYQGMQFSDKHQCGFWDSVLTY